MSDFSDVHDGSSLAARQISGFPVSLATSLSLESLFPMQLKPYDPERKVPQVVDLNKYGDCWFNVSTLFRNMVGALDREVASKIPPRDYAMALETEIDVINSLFLNEGRGVCKPQFYVCNYDKLKMTGLKLFHLREDKTDIQRAYTKKHDDTVKLMLKTNDVIRNFDLEIKTQGPRTNAIVLTHQPWDLLSHKNFNRLDLLESNTGRLKSRYLWSTKYYPIGTADMSILPFNRKLLLLIGDRSLIHPQDMKVRRLVLECAVKNKWTSMTTESKVLDDLRNSTMDPMLVMLFNTL